MLPRGELQQHVADAADRPADRDRAEHGDAGKDGDDEQTDAEVDPAACVVSAFACALRSSAAPINATVVASISAFISSPSCAGALDLLDGVAVVLRRGGEFADDVDIVFDQCGELLEPFLVGRFVGDIERVLDMPCRRGLVGVEPVQRAIDLARRDGEANFARLDLHAAQIVGGAQRLDGGELLAVGGGALPRGVSDRRICSFDQHSGDQEHADAGPERELGANRKIESWPSSWPCGSHGIINAAG